MSRGREGWTDGAVFLIVLRLAYRVQVDNGRVLGCLPVCLPCTGCLLGS